MFDKKEYYKKRYQKNKEVVKTYNIKYRQEHKEGMRAYRKKYHQDHRKKENARSKEWYREHKKEKSIKSQEREKEKRLKALNLLGNKCVFCNRNTGRLLFHEVCGKNHPADAAGLVLGGAKNFVLLHYSCHDAVHLLMKHLGMTWDEIEKRIIERKKGVCYGDSKEVE